MTQDSLNKEIYHREQITITKLYLTMAGLLLAGSLATILMKIQNGTDAEVDGKIQQWNHPLLQTAFMFFGELICLFIYYVMKYRGDINEKKHQNKQIRKVWFIIPTGLDFIASTMVFIGLSLVAASIYQMMKGLLVVIIAKMGYFFLKKKQYRHHWFAIGLIITGIFFVGLSNYNTSTGASSKNVSLGLFLLITGQVFQGLQYVIEEKLFQDVDLHPMYVIGWEGVWGCTLWLILLPIFQVTPCDYSICSNGKVEDTILAFQQMAANPLLLQLSIGIILMIASLNTFGLTITKYASAAQRSTVDASRILFVWIFFLMYPFQGQEQFKLLQLFGFMILLCGTLIHNEIVTIPYFGLSQHTKFAIEQRKVQAQPLLFAYNEKSIEANSDYALDLEGKGSPTTLSNTP